MKKLSLAFVISLFTLPSFSQTFLMAGAGSSLNKGGIVEFRVGHSINNHSLALMGMVHLSSREPEYGGIVYGYSIGSIQPYIGYGYQKMTSDHQSPENTWKPSYGIQINYHPNEDAPAGLYLNAGGIGNEFIITAGLNLKF